MTDKYGIVFLGQKLMKDEELFKEKSQIYFYYAIG